MKIGILTLPIAENYGGILQAVALYRLLHNQGHDITLIYKETSPNEKLWKKIIKEILLKVPFHDFKNLKANNKTNMKAKEEWKKRKKLHRLFIEKEIFKISQDLYTKKDLNFFVKNEKLDALIVGSDQVWRKKYINDKYYKSYFLDFLDGSKIKKIAYAASFGKDHWEGKKDEEEISKLLNDFTAVSTRELSGVKVCKETFKYDNARHVVDPTILMSKEFYINEIISKYDTSKISNGGLLTYVLDEEKEKKDIIELVQKNTKIKNINHLKGFNSSNTTYTVSEWIASFANADFIVTDSFHGMVFSIIFEKEFVVIGNKDRGLDRFTSLLSLLSLEDKLVFDTDDLNDKKMESIDYERVNKLLENEKKNSLEFLNKSLSYE